MCYSKSQECNNNRSQLHLPIPLAFNVHDTQLRYAKVNESSGMKHITRRELQHDSLLFPDTRIRHCICMQCTVVKPSTSFPDNLRSVILDWHHGWL